ncbi:MAG: ferrous iron transport protein B [Candidatus Acetothermia bacterium]|jgi:ferrous iron transport protein B|nr:ferrous iron transport protein B [Candidatus Acetothermia bacterium]MDH7505080.1 ferrous iron transport protein B [Candidatus Acetothermia bacterium]
MVERVSQAQRTITVALAGQPNVGKSTVFNLLTGLSQHVGNWPGKTVERKTGIHQHNGTIMRIVDLPGTYSLTANSLEERIARDYIIKERPDVVVAVADATALERNLYLVAELLSLPVPVIVALNMIDVAEQQGLHIEPHVLEAALGLPVVPMVATKGRGLTELVEAIARLAQGEVAYAPSRPRIREDHRAVLEELERLIADAVPEPYPNDWVALKLLEGDEELTRMIREQLAPERWEEVHSILRRHEDAVLAVAGGRYEWIGRMVRAAVTRPRAGQISLTERLDRVAAHPVWGLGLLLGVLGLVFFLTYAIGSPLQGLLEAHLVRAGADWAARLLAGAPAWLVGLVANGLIGGVGRVLTFLPILLVFFAAFGFLEDLGYMARAAYVMDRFMHRMGLHGKSFLPLFLGFGCNVPAVMGARVVEGERARLLTILVAPLVPCTARMAVLAFLVPIFFGRASTLVSWGLVAFNLLILVLLGIGLNKLVFRGERAAFIMELPLYHIPNLRTIGLFVWRRTAAFIRRAGTIILAVSVLIAALAALPSGELGSSYLAAIGRFLAPLGALMGLGWEMMVALLTSFVAKETAIATLGVLYGAGAGGEAGLAGILGSLLAPSAALAFLVVEMLFIPCAATVATIRQETGSWRWTLLDVALLLVLSLAMGLLVYQGARLLGWGT